jgi:hypothetical protein
MRLDLDVRIEVADPVTRRFELGMPDVARAVEHLPLQVGDVDDVEIDEAERADSRRREIERGRRPQPARADEQHTRRLDPLLAVEADVRQDEVAAIAVELFAGEIHAGNLLWGFS